MASFWNEINPLNPSSPLYLLPGPSLTPGQKKHGPGSPLSPGPNNPILTQPQQQTGQAAVGQAAGGISDLLGLSGVEALAVRALEALAGGALILLGLQALTGGSGNPADAARRAARVVR